MRSAPGGTGWSRSTAVPELSPLHPLGATLAALLAWLRAEDVRGMVIGGVAASLLGRPRTTRDVDALVWIEEPSRWQGFLASGLSHGFEPRIDDALEFALRARVLLLRHAPTGIDVDLSFGGLPFEDEALTRAGEAKLGDLRVPLPAPEDLVIMKAVAHRPRDTADIEAILEAHPKLDRERIRMWVREFAGVLEAPELLDDLESLLTRVAPPRAARKRRRPAR
jgi:Nucleotidyl transferase AbiEii toxin, Type IV TA system